MEKMTVEELLGRYEAGERDFSGIMLERSAVLEGVNFRGADFRNACINNANLRGADLRDTNLSKCILDISRNHWALSRQCFGRFV